MSVLGNEYLSAISEKAGFSSEKINSSSVDLKISNKVTLVDFQGYRSRSSIAKADQYNVNPYDQMFVDNADWEPTIRYTDVDLNEFPDGIWIRPGVGVLCTSESTLRMPKDVVAQALLKSSRGREFYQSCMAGYVDNGFPGQLTLEIYAPVIPVFFQTGLRIVQLRFDELTDYSFDYTTQPDAKYVDQSGPTPSRDSRF